MKLPTNQLRSYNAGILQGKAYRVLTANLTDTLAPYDLSIPEWKLLGQLTEYNDIKLARLAEILGVEPPLVTSLAASLEKKKLIKRIDDKNDKRTKVVTGTKKGLELVEKIEPVVRAKLRELLKGTSKLELLAYSRVLSAIVKNG